MAGTLTVTFAQASNPRVITLDWVSTAGGAVSESVFLQGTIARVIIIPSGSAAPTALYDMTLVGLGSIDLLSGQGANLSATVTSEVCPLVTSTDGTTATPKKRAVSETVTLTIANAGDTKEGQVIIYLTD